jgi:hypothetical protein
MSEHYVNQPAPGASSQEGAYLRNPQEPSYYFHDANQYAAVQGAAPAGTEAQPLPREPHEQSVQAASSSALGSWFNVTNSTYLKGALLGAGVALVVTNPRVQQAVISGAVRLWAGIQGGVEEIKEQVRDVKAELSREG